MDEDKIFRIRINRKLQFCEARAILILLGFDGAQNFARISGVNHETAAAILGTCHMKHRKHHYNLIAVHEGLHTAYMERRADLNAATRRYICDWARRWQKDVVENKLLIESKGKIKADASKSVERDRKRKRKIVRDGVWTAFKALEWK